MEWFSSAFFHVLSPHLVAFTKSKCCQKVPCSRQITVNLEMPSSCGWEDILVQSLLMSVFQADLCPGQRSLLMGTWLKLSSAGQFLHG